MPNVDKMASNGVLHELKTVMIPPSGNIVEAVAGCPVFKTLVTAVKAAGLVDTLSGQFKTEPLASCSVFDSDLHFKNKNKSASGVWIVEPFPKVLASEEKVTTTS